MEMMTLGVEAILPESADTKTIFLHRTDGLPLLYRAGQFLTLLFYRNGRELRRSYSFSTTPGVDPVPGITVKRVANGEISRHLFDHLRPGDTLTSLPPGGRFTLATADETGMAVTGQTAKADGGRADLFFIAAGSGLAPVFSLIKAALATHPAGRTTLLSQQHDVTATPFLGQLNMLAAEYGPDGFRWIQSLTVRDGRLNLEKLEATLEATVTHPDATRFYLCGPPAFMRMVQFALRTYGIPEQQIKREHFTVEHRPPPPANFDTASRKVLLHMSSGDQTFTVSWPDTILTAGLKHGIPMPYSCRAGRCSSCVARLLSGRIHMTVNEVLTEKDLEAGLVLTCVGYAETDLSLSFALFR
jgi:ring-1,2-phenylacetyl-CoA epoxidase subunit PaaE